MKPLGDMQRSVLRSLCVDRRSGMWYAGCGWVWGTAASMERVLDSLVRRRLVDKRVTKVKGRLRPYYQVNEAGRKVAATPL